MRRYYSVKDKVCTIGSPRWSLSWFLRSIKQLRVLLLSPGWDVSHCKVNTPPPPPPPPTFHQASLTIQQYLCMLLGGEGYYMSKLFYPRTQHMTHLGLEPRPLDAESSTLTIWPLHLKSSVISYIVYHFIYKPVCSPLTQPFNSHK